MWERKMIYKGQTIWQSYDAEGRRIYAATNGQYEPSTSTYCYSLKSIKEVITDAIEGD